MTNLNLDSMPEKEEKTKKSSESEDGVKLQLPKMIEPKTPYVNLEADTDGTVVISEDAQEEWKDWARYG